MEERLNRVSEEKAAIEKLSWRWCDRGLALAAMYGPLKMLTTNLLSGKSPRDALENWEEYVGWHFWNPCNQAKLVELYARNGDYDKAIKALRLIKGRDHYEQAKLVLADEKKQSPAVEAARFQGDLGSRRDPKNRKSPARRRQNQK